jgi:hypothetical protein
MPTSRPTAPRQRRSSKAQSLASPSWLEVELRWDLRAECFRRYDLMNRRRGWHLDGDLGLEAGSRGIASPRCPCLGDVENPVFSGTQITERKPQVSLVQTRPILGTGYCRLPWLTRNASSMERFVKIFLPTMGGGEASVYIFRGVL